MKEIKTNNGIYEYQEVIFQNGIKKIDRVIAKANLLDVKLILDSNNINFGLIYGTLLGAIRENNFIAHDEDTDIFMLEESRDAVFNILFELRGKGFEVGRCTENLISIIKNNEYIDIYFFKKVNANKRDCEGYVIKSSYLENLEQIDFLGQQFSVPQNPESLLVHLYGKDWRIPKENTPASNYGLYLTIKFYIKNNFTSLFKVITTINKKIKK